MQKKSIRFLYGIQANERVNIAVNELEQYFVKHDV